MIKECISMSSFHRVSFSSLLLGSALALVCAQGCAVPLEGDDGPVEHSGTTGEALTSSVPTSQTFTLPAGMTPAQYCASFTNTTGFFSGPSVCTSWNSAATYVSQSDTCAAAAAPTTSVATSQTINMASAAYCPLFANQHGFFNGAAVCAGVGAGWTYVSQNDTCGSGTTSATTKITGTVTCDKPNNEVTITGAVTCNVVQDVSNTLTQTFTPPTGMTGAQYCASFTNTGGFFNGPAECTSLGSGYTYVSQHDVCSYTDPQSSLHESQTFTPPTGWTPAQYCASFTNTGGYFNGAGDCSAGGPGWTYQSQSDSCSTAGGDVIVAGTVVCATGTDHVTITGTVTCQH
jgi:hypothetical protein